jgi:hypothetical protein
MGASHRAVRFPDQLGNEVQVAYGDKKRGNFTERLIDIDLLQVGLRQSFGVAPVIRRGAVEDDLSVAPDLFLAQVQAALLLVESHLVGPLDVIGQFERGCYLNIGKAACRQAAEGADPPAPAHGFLQAAAGNGQIAQEPEGIQKVGLARSIGPDEKEPPANLLSRMCAKVRTVLFLPRRVLLTTVVSDRRDFPDYGGDGPRRSAAIAGRTRHG